MRWLSFGLIWICLTELAGAQWAPPPPMPQAPPQCITQIVTLPGGRVMICTTCYAPTGPTTFCS